MDSNNEKMVNYSFWQLCHDLKDGFLPSISFGVLKKPVVAGKRGVGTPRSTYYTISPFSGDSLVLYCQALGNIDLHSQCINFFLLLY